MNVLAAFFRAGMRSSRCSLFRRTSLAPALPPLIPLSRRGTLLLLMGLLALLTPLFCRQQAERYHRHIENDIEPAREQIGRTLALAREARSDMAASLLLAHYASTRQLSLPHRFDGDISERLTELTESDRAPRACGDTIYGNWQIGIHALARWQRECARLEGAETAPDAATLRRMDRLFTQGIAALRLAQTQLRQRQSGIRRRLRAFGRAEFAITAPLSLICLLLAQSAWQTQMRLRRSWMVAHTAALHLQETNHRLETLATTDGLTGLKNHRAFQERLEHAFRLGTRHERPLSLLLLDVDHFKRYNDTYGHPAGDEILKQVAAILTATCRVTDIAARYGGEEFVVILPDTSRAGAILLAERFRAQIAEARWPLAAITVSVGAVTSLADTVDQTQLIAQADTALYISKQEGRNRVTHYAEAFADRLPDRRNADHAPRMADPFNATADTLLK